MMQQAWEVKKQEYEHTNDKLEDCGKEVQHLCMCMTNRCISMLTGYECQGVTSKEFQQEGKRDQEEVNVD